MKTWKLVSGILSVVFFLFVTLQSCAASMADALTDGDGIGGAAGLIVALMLLSGGIVSIAVRKGGNGGNIALIVLFGIGALCGYTMAGNYSDLPFWASWCLVCAVLALVSLIRSSKKTN